jgi:hypothetical protein
MATDKYATDLRCFVNRKCSETFVLIAYVRIDDRRAAQVGPY